MISNFDLANPEFESSQTSENKAVLKDPVLLDDSVKNSVLEDIVRLDVVIPAKSKNFQEGKCLKRLKLIGTSIKPGIKLSKSNQAAKFSKI